MIGVQLAWDQPQAPAWHFPGSYEFPALPRVGDFISEKLTISESATGVNFQQTFSEWRVTRIRIWTTGITLYVVPEEGKVETGRPGEEDDATANLVAALDAATEVLSDIRRAAEQVPQVSKHLHHLDQAQACYQALRVWATEYREVPL